MKRWSEKGAAVVEFAIVLPILLVIVFGIVEFGFILYNQAMLTNATREGARGGILATSPRQSTNSIDQNVKLYAADFLFNFDNSPITTVISLSEDNGSIFTILPLSDEPIDMEPAVDYIRVEASCDYNFLVLPNFIKRIGIKKTLRARATMRAE